MPYSLKWIAGLLACAILAAPASLVVQKWETTHAARATAQALTGGDPKAGRAAMGRYGCGACHQIEGVPGAQGKVGPALSGLARRTTVAGVLPNDPPSLIRWLRTPQAVKPGSGMPNMGVSERDARDMAAYAYTLR